MIDIENTNFNNIKEISGISDYDYNSEAKKIMRGICYSIRQNYGRIIRIPFTTMIFSGVVENRYAGNLSRLIKRAKLGEVMCTNPKVNPNSDNVIGVYIWTVDKVALSRWYKRNRKEYEDDNE